MRRGMRRYHLLRTYALAVGLGLFVVGLVGIMPALPAPLAPDAPANLLHIGAGLLFGAGVWVSKDLSQLRTFVFGMGTLLVLGKLIIGLSHWPQVGPDTALVEIICFVVGVGSVLITALIGRPPPEG